VSHPLEFAGHDIGVCRLLLAVPVLHKPVSGFRAEIYLSKRVSSGVLPLQQVVGQHLMLQCLKLLCMLLQDAVVQGR